MGRTLRQLALLLALCGVCCASAPARHARPPATIIATVAPAPQQPGGLEVTVTGALLPGKGWVSSEDAAGFLRKGDRLTLYALQEGVLGSVALTDSGKLLSAEEEGEVDIAEGLVFRARPVLAAGRRAAHARALGRQVDDVTPFIHIDMLAAQMADGSPPRWVNGKLLPGARRHGGTHWKLAADWLRARGVTEEAIAGMDVAHAVQADFDRDGRDEVFLSLHGKETWAETEGEASSRTQFSYLLMRRLQPGTGRTETVVLDDQAYRSLWVVGFCDLDHDGRAEVITEGSGIDYSGADVFHWDGKRFRTVAGWACGP